jgi:hypothetical protein
VEQKSSLQVLESPNDQHHADGNVECRCIVASEQATGDDSNVICSNASLALHGVAQVATHSQVASQGTGVINVHDAEAAMS